jgi:transcriptional regulator of arginine metabolism
MNKVTKKSRQKTLRSIISQIGIRDQHHLLNEMKRKGIDTTQATVSRDLQDLGYIKIRTDPGVYKYDLIEKVSVGSLWKRLQVLFDNFVVGIRSTGNMILIKTSPGNANGVASLMDGLEMEEILGTIAGDDTVLVIIDKDENRTAVEKKFNDLLLKSPAI